MPRNPEKSLLTVALALLLGSLSVTLGCQSDRPVERHQPTLPGDALARPMDPAPSDTVVLRAFHPRGVPLHPRARSRAVSGRLPDGLAVKVVAERAGGRWLLVRAENGTEGWITRRYVDWAASRRRPGGGRPGAPPADETCPRPDPTAPRELRVVHEKPFELGPKPSAAPPPAPANLTVVSYNVWELYDGQGGDRYRSRKHAGTLSAADVQTRVKKLAAQIRAAKPHIIAFQEIESAAMACRVAHAALPGHRWSCAGGPWGRRPFPQSLATASRVKGTFRSLTPKGRWAPRGVMEFTTAKGKLSILSVHLKSSLGRQGAEDCRNAARRQAMAQAIVNHLRATRQKVASLVLGDFNFEPPRATHDRTDETLTGAGFKSLRVRFYPKGAPDTYPSYRSMIDLAFFRRPRGLGITATGFRVIVKAVTNRWTSDHRPVVVTLKTR